MNDLFSRFCLPNKPGGGHIAVALIMMLTALALPGCSGKEQAHTRPNVILITIDTLRADHLSCYGYNRETSPFIDSIARQGTLFMNSYSTSSWTAPSMISIFTSLYPRNYGMQSGLVKDPGTISGQLMLPPDVPTIAEIMKKAGYTTFGLASHGLMSSKTGFDRGFDYFITLLFNSAPIVNKKAKQWKEEIQRASRYFLWIHYFDPHSPYNAREPWITRYNSQKQAYQKWASIDMKNLLNVLKKIQEDPGAIKALSDLYDSEINYCDDHLRELFKILPLEDNSMIIITSDHGEEFLDHKHIGHQQTLFEEVIRVPLIVKLPDGTAARKIVDQPVSNKDILPTILDAVGEKIPEGLGKSFLPLITGDAKDSHDPIYSELYLTLDKTGYWRAIRSGKWKFMFKELKSRKPGKLSREQQKTQITKQRFLSDLQTDPRETKNLLARHPDIAQRLESKLDQWMRTHPVFKVPKTNVSLNKEEEEELRSLGYLE